MSVGWRGDLKARGDLEPLVMVHRAVPRSSLLSLLKKHKPQLRHSKDVHIMVHLDCLLFLHRLAMEARTKAVESKSSTIQPNDVKEVAKAILKKSRG